MSQDISSPLVLLRRLAVCKWADPYATKPWAREQLNKWRTVNVPADLWGEVLRLAHAPSDDLPAPANQSGEDREAFVSPRKSEDE